MQQILAYSLLIFNKTYSDIDVRRVDISLRSWSTRGRICIYWHLCTEIPPSRCKCLFVFVYHTMPKSDRQTSLCGMNVKKPQKNDGPGFFSTSRVFFSTSYLFFNLRCLFFNLRGSVFISTSFFLFFQPHMSFFGPHISSHVFFSTSHIFFSTSHVFLSTLYVSLSTCNVSFPSPLDWFLFGMLSVLWVNVGFLWSAF